MAITLKETKKKNFKFKGGSIENGKVHNDGEEVDLIGLLVKAYGDNAFFELSVTEKSEEEFDIDDSPTSDDKE